MKKLIILLVICPLLPIIGIVWLTLGKLEKWYDYNQKHHVSK